MCFTGPLVAVGFALLFAGLYRVASAPRPLGEREDWALAGLGAAIIGAGLELWRRGVI